MLNMRQIHCDVSGETSSRHASGPWISATCTCSRFNHSGISVVSCISWLGCININKHQVTLGSHATGQHICNQPLAINHAQ